MTYSVCVKATKNDLTEVVKPLTQTEASEMEINELYFLWDNDYL